MALAFGFDRGGSFERASPLFASRAPPTGAPAGSGGGSACSRLPAGKRIVKLNLKPETEVADLVAWISSITCKQFVLPDVPASHAKVTIVAPSLITSGEAYRLFLDALDSVGLTVYPSGPFLRIIESGEGEDLSRSRSSGSAAEALPRGGQVSASGSCRKPRPSRRARWRPRWRRRAR